MAVIVIDGVQALELLTEVVEGNEDYIDPYAQAHSTCRYVDNQMPSCIVGRALAKAGVSIRQLASLDRYVGNIDQAVPGNYSVTEFELTLAARAIFAAAQKRQDRGAPWGTALADARYAAGIRD